MNYTTFLPLGLIAGVLFFTACKLTLAISSNFRAGQRLRNAFQDRLNLIRFKKVLTHFEIDNRQYLHALPLSSIESQIRHCETCAATSQCDKELKKANASAVELAFCPNIRALQEFSAEVETAIPVSS